MATFGETNFTADREATLSAYGTVERGGTDKCACATCRNFSEVREKVFPPAFLEFLRTLGVDPRKEAEAYHNARLSPGRHDYGGWFHFVGALKENGRSYVDFGNGFTAYLCPTSAPGHKQITQLASVQLEFHSDQVPWVLEEPEPD